MINITGSLNRAVAATTQYLDSTTIGRRLMQWGKKLPPVKVELVYFVAGIALGAFAHCLIKAREIAKIKQENHDLKVQKKTDHGELRSIFETQFQSSNLNLRWHYITLKKFYVLLQTREYEGYYKSYINILKDAVQSLVKNVLTSSRLISKLNDFIFTALYLHAQVFILRYAANKRIPNVNKIPDASDEKILAFVIEKSRELIQCDPKCVDNFFAVFEKELKRLLNSELTELRKGPLDLSLRGSSSAEIPE